MKPDFHLSVKVYTLDNSWERATIERGGIMNLKSAWATQATLFQKTICPHRKTHAVPKVVPAFTKL